MEFFDELIHRTKAYLQMVDEPDGHIGTPERDGFFAMDLDLA